jgi:hypothetical protein
MMSVQLRKNYSDINSYPFYHFKRCSYCMNAIDLQKRKDAEPKCIV